MVFTNAVLHYNVTILLLLPTVVALLALQISNLYWFIYLNLLKDRIGYIFQLENLIQYW